MRTSEKNLGRIKYQKSDGIVANSSGGLENYIIRIMEVRRCYFGETLRGQYQFPLTAEKYCFMCFLFIKHSFPKMVSIRHC